MTSSEGNGTNPHKPPAKAGERLSFEDLARFEWHDRSIVCRFSRSVLTLSTSRRHGGERRDVTAAVNYRICDPGGCPTCEVCLDQLDDYIDRHVEGLGCDPATTATMLTSASVSNAGWASRSYEGVKVFSMVTAGVSENAARAGDPASHHETAEGWKPDAERPLGGTINSVLLINHGLTSGALVKAGIMLTEAKSATLQALRVRSMQGDGIATGTGTDQFVIACPQSSPFTLTEAQAHVGLGQMIAESLSEALEAALLRQNGLDLATRRSVRALLMRFCADVDAGAKDGDAHAVAAAAALAAVFDHLRWGILPASERPLVVAGRATELARAIAPDETVAAQAESRVGAALKSAPDMADREVVQLVVDVAGGR
jgi:adenosylcobinamide amidohydrolase